jgi:hypothetical protein
MSFSEEGAENKHVITFIEPLFVKQQQNTVCNPMSNRIIMHSHLEVFYKKIEQPTQQVFRLISRKRVILNSQRHDEIFVKLFADRFHDM